MWEGSKNVRAVIPKFGLGSGGKGLFISREINAARLVWFVRSAAKTGHALDKSGATVFFSSPTLLSTPRNRRRRQKKKKRLACTLASHVASRHHCLETWRLLYN